MSVNPNEDTEFNDALRKHGIIPPKEEAPPSPPPPPSPTLSDFLDDLSPAEMRELAETTNDDVKEREILAHRQQRLAQERKDQQKARFGRVFPIGREDYTREITDASKIDEEDDEDEQGTGVVCCLYKDGIPRSDTAMGHIRTLAARYPRTKFVSIVGDKCIPNLPDARVPMFIVYRKGEIKNQIFSWGADRPRKIEELEVALVVSEAINTPPSFPPASDRRRDDDSEDEDSDDDRKPSSRMRSAGTSTNGRTGKNIRQGGTKKKGDDDDSDFDFDL